MEHHDFDELLAQLRQLSDVFGVVYRDITGEEFDAEGAIRHYPLVALGIVAGAGVLAGMWLGRRQIPEARQLPPPPPTPPSRPLDYLEQLLPQPFERVREALPEIMSEDAGAIARAWLESVEPAFRETVDNTRLGSFLKRAFDRTDQNGEGGGTAPER